MTLRVSVIGLGKLGASIAAAAASRGVEVIGVDVDRQAVERLNAGLAPVQETDLDETIAANRARLRATLSYREAVHESDVTFVVVPTPSDESGMFMLDYAEAAFRNCGRALADKDGYHNVVLMSTVLPGSMRYRLLPALEQESGRVSGRDLGVCYSPQFVALGCVIRNFLHPDFTLIGESDAEAGNHLESCYRQILTRFAPCARMSLENAELTKIAVNTYVTTKITFANMLADLCERIPGGDVDVVTRALSLDRRIGPGALAGGLGYGGPCFPRDNVALAALARVLGTHADLAEITDFVNRSLPEKVVGRLSEFVRPGTAVAVLGLAYKPGTQVIEESPGIQLVRSLSAAGARVLAYDPLANEPARAALAGAAEVLDSLAECLESADVVVVATPDPEFRLAEADAFAGKTVVDFWRLLAEDLGGRGDLRYVAAGRGANDPARESRLLEFWGEGATQLR